MQPLRGEVWDAYVPRAGEHPFVVLSVNSMIARLGSVIAVLVTGTTGPSATHIPLSNDAGLTGRGESYANATDLHQLPTGSLRRRRGRLHPAEMAALEDAVRVYLGL
jgi:mRNA interferase MazF